MRGPNAFCPGSGAPLSERRHHRAGRPQRHSTSGDVEYGGVLTNGELVSSRTALLRYFEDCHGRHAGADDPSDQGSGTDDAGDRHAGTDDSGDRDGPDDALYRAAATALVRLKRVDGKHWDVWVWVALQECLARRGFDVDWMAGHATARCPRCAGRLRWERGPTDEPRPRCVGTCDADAGLLDALHEEVRTLYARAFEPIERLTVA